VASIDVTTYEILSRSVDLLNGSSKDLNPTDLARIKLLITLVSRRRARLSHDFIVEAIRRRMQRGRMDEASAAAALRRANERNQERFLPTLTDGEFEQIASLLAFVAERIAETTELQSTLERVLRPFEEDPLRNLGLDAPADDEL